MENSKGFLQRLTQRKRWTDTTLKTCFEKKPLKVLSTKGNNQGLNPFEQFGFGQV
ncbi:MAG: hypothetical protein ABSE95_15315 [Thermodesulfobacteriota bacterium]